MLNALNGSIQAELVRFLNVINDSYLSTTSVTTAAFCNARMKLSRKEFIELNHGLVKTFYDKVANYLPMLILIIWQLLD
jgi:hypothetical protein